jgi:hypothetical protein
MPYRWWRKAEGVSPSAMVDPVGIMEAAGLARHASGNAFLLIGVAPALEVPPLGKTPVDPHYFHVVAVDNPPSSPRSWGSETDALAIWDTR